MAHTKDCLIQALMDRDAGERIHCECGQWEREDKAKWGIGFLIQMAQIAGLISVFDRTIRHLDDFNPDKSPKPSTTFSF